MSKRNNEKNLNETPERGVRERIDPVDEKADIPAFLEYGIVTGCKKLNVRSLPDISGKVICTIDASEDVVIIDKDGGMDFYKIRTSSGVEGFCMKKYITIRK